MGPMMYLVPIVLCLGIVYCDETESPVTVTPETVTLVTPETRNSTSRVSIRNKVQNLTVQYTSDHGQNTSYVISPSPINQTTEKPLIISTSKEVRLIKTPAVSDSVATATRLQKNNSTLRPSKETKHHGRTNHKKDQPNHFLPTVRPDSSKVENVSKHAVSPKKINSTKPATLGRNANQTKIQSNIPKQHSGHQQPPSKNSDISRNHVPTHLQNARSPHLHNKKPNKDKMGHASDMEMFKLEVKEVRFVESPKDNGKFSYFVVADDEIAANEKASTSSQMFEMTFPSKSPPRNAQLGTKSMNKYKVGPKTSDNYNENLWNTTKFSPYPTTASVQTSTKSMDKYKVAPTVYSNYLQNNTKLNPYPTIATPLQYMTPPMPTVYTVRSKLTSMNHISITTFSPPHKEFNSANRLGAKPQTHPGTRDFSCLRCVGNNHNKNYKFPSYPSNYDPMLDGNRAVILLGPEGDNFLGGTKQYYVVAKPGKHMHPNSTSPNHKEQKSVTQGPKRQDKPTNQGKPKPAPKRPNAPTTSRKINTTTKRPGGQRFEKHSSQKQKNLSSMEELGSYAPPNFERPKVSFVPEKPENELRKRPANSTNKPTSPPQSTRNPYSMDGPKGGYASSSMPMARPHDQNLHKYHSTQKPRSPSHMDGLRSYASPNKERPKISSVPEKTPHDLQKQKGNSTSKQQHTSTPSTRNPYHMDGSTGSYASSNIAISVTNPNLKSTKSRFKIDPSTDVYHLDEELQGSASYIRKHHANVKVETKEIHIPVPEIVETRVPYPIHIKVDRPVAVHIDKPYPVHVEKKVPVPVKINVPQPYPVEKEVPYPVKIPIEVPRPVEVAKPVPYIVEHPVPIQVFKEIKVPVKLPIDVPVPYKVNVQVEKRVPFFIEKKVPFEVPVPVEKPYLVQVKKPFEVPQEKPQAVTVEKKIPVPVQVVEYVQVPIPVQPPHGQHSYQPRLGEMTDQRGNLAAQSSHLVEIPVELNQPKPDTQSADDQSTSASNHQPSRVKVLLPNMISVEFPADFGHQPTGPASGFLPTTSEAQVRPT